VTDYLTILSRLKAKGFASDEAKTAQQYGLDRPSLKITLGGDDGKQLGALLLRDGANAEYYAKREDNPTVYVIEEFFYRQLDKRAGDFLGEETKK
jgi:hypothetical protein